MDPSEYSIVLKFVSIVLLLIGSAFFSSAETAMTSINKIKLKTLYDSGDRRATIITNILENPGKFLSTVLVGNNIVNLSVSAIATTLAIDLYGNNFVGIATGILTLVLLVFGEIMPKTLANNHSEKVALFYADSLKFLIFILKPIVAVVDFATKLIMRIFGIDMSPKYSFVTESELKAIISVGHEDGAIQDEEKDYIENVFDFKIAYAKDVMVPKVDIVSIDINASFDEVVTVFKKEQYTRYPIHDGDSSHVIGLINIKDLLMNDYATNKDKFKIEDIMRQPYYTFEFKKTSELLVEMREDVKHLKTSMAIVLDEYGSAVGIITLEDLLEELVGEIRDEYDEHEESLIQDLGNNKYVIEGSMKLDDINDSLDLEDKGLELDSEDFDSIGGLVIELLDRIPEQDESVTTDTGIKLTANQVDGRRIEKVILDLSHADLSEEE